MWRGKALVDLEDWDPARAEAARLDELRLSAEELYVESHLRSGQHERVLAKARALVEEAPLRERRWALLALAQYQAGRQAEALATLRRLRQVLDRELGLQPGHEIAELEEAVLRQDPDLVVTVGLPEAGTTCPYQGLLAYDVDDADGFFGRDGTSLHACGGSRDWDAGRGRPLGLREVVPGAGRGRGLPAARRAPRRDHHPGRPSR